MHALHNAIGSHIVEQAGPIVGPEFRFLRKQMGLRQCELASVMRTSDQTVGSYEKGKTEPSPADGFMRISYLLGIIPDEEVPADVLKTLADRLRTGRGAAFRLPPQPACAAGARAGRRRERRGGDPVLPWRSKRSSPPVVTAYPLLSTLSHCPTKASVVLQQRHGFADHSSQRTDWGHTGQVLCPVESEKGV